MRTLADRRLSRRILGRFGPGFEEGPAQDTLTTGRYNRIEGQLVVSRQLEIASVRVWAFDSEPMQLTIAGQVVFSGVVATTGDAGHVVPTSMILPVGIHTVRWAVANPAVDVRMYGRDANFVGAVTSMLADNRFVPSSGSSSSPSYCPAFILYGWSA